VGLPLLAGVTAGVVLVAAMIAGGAGGRQHRNVPAGGGQAMTGPAMLRYTLTGVRSPATAVDLPPARAVLLHLAQVAAAQRPVPKPAGADVSYTRALEWSGTTFITPRGPVDTPLIMGPVQSWTAPDGAVMSWDCAGETACRPYDYQMIPAGQRFSMGAGPLASTLPADPVALRARLLAQTVDQRPNSGTTQKIIETIVYGLASQVLTPQQEATLWRVLAGLSDIRYMGTVRDRDGRPGVAVEYLGNFWIRNDYRYVLIISPDTGRLLGEEVIQLPVHMGAHYQVRPGGSGPVVTGYLVFISQGWASRLGGPVR
jgi:hypothetical protein